MTDEFMRAFVLYDPATGRVEKSGMCGPLDWEAQEQDGLEIMITEEFITFPAFVKDDLIHPLPPSPGDWAVFDRETETWTDPRQDTEKAHDLGVARTSAIDKINTLSGRARLAMVTDIPGQQMIYLQKEQEAKDFFADPDPQLENYPLIAAEVGVIAETPYEVAQIWANMAHGLVLWAARLEKARMSAITQLEQAQTEEDLQSIVDNFAPI